MTDFQIFGALCLYALGGSAWLLFHDWLCAQYPKHRRARVRLYGLERFAGWLLWPVCALWLLFHARYISNVIRITRSRG